MPNISAIAVRRLDGANFQLPGQRPDRCGRCAHSRATRHVGRLWCGLHAAEVPSGAICDEHALAKPWPRHRISQVSAHA